MQQFQGSCVALITPMLPDGAIDWQSLEGLLEWHIGEGTSALVIAGTTGEAPTLSESEQEALFRFVVERVKGRLPIMVGTGTNCTHSTVRRTQMAQACGVDAALIVTPYYNRPPQQGVFAHFSTVAKQTSLPIMLYNHPGRTGCNIEGTTIARLSEIKNIFGVKDATADLENLRMQKNWVHPDFVFLSGDDATACEYVLQGGHGVISVSANIAPARMQACMHNALSGSKAKARELDQALQVLHEAMGVMVNPIPVKAMLHLMGKIAPGIRLPLVWADESCLEKLKQMSKTIVE